MDTKKYDVFISYSSDDLSIVKKIYAFLESNNIRCFFAEYDIPKGKSWPDAIPPAIHKSGMMLAVFSKNFNDSEQTSRELTIAADKKCKIPILAFRITDDGFEGAKEYFLTMSNWIEAFPNPEDVFSQLHHSICVMLGIDDDAGSKQASTEASPQPSMSEEEKLVQKGLAIIKDENADRDMATYYFRKAAKAGYPEGEYRLGMAYYEGSGIPHSWEDAILWFNKASEHGHSAAMERLAAIYRYGIGIERNSMRALELYTKAAQAGNGRAMKALGRVYHTGELGVQDEQRSREYYELAFDTLYEQAMGKNDGDAQQVLGNSYLDGEGVKPSHSLAVQMYTRAIANHIPDAYNCLGLCYDSGLGVEKDRAKGFEYQLKSAELGHLIAMGNVASAYRHGDGTEKNEEKYWIWIKKAADRGSSSAQYSIGLNYGEGELCEKDMQLAKNWFEKAINGGNYDAMDTLGVYIEYGYIKAENGVEEAVQLYKQAAMGGDVYAYIHLADCYYRGTGIEENDVEAARWYSKIADVYEQMKERGENYFVSDRGGGHVTLVNFDDEMAKFFAGAFENLAWIYRYSKTVEHNEALADKWDAIAKKLNGEKLDEHDAERDDEEEMTEAEELAETGDDYYYGKNGKEQDYVEAVKYFRQAAELGYAYAQYSLAFCYQRGQGVPADDVEAARWFEMAAEQGHADSQCSYGICCEYGEGVPKSIEEAVMWYQKSADQDWPLAQNLLGDCYFYGKGVEQDIEQAKVWYEKAAEHGEDLADEKLKRIHEYEKNPRLYVVKDDEMFGYADLTGKLVVPCQYTKVQEFDDGIGLVWNGSLVGAVDLSGKLVLPCTIACKKAKYLGHGLIRTRAVSLLYSIYDFRGKDVNNELFTEMGDKFIDGYVPAVKYRQIGKDRPGKIDTSGKFHPD